MIRAAIAFVIAFTLMWGLQGTWQVAHGQTVQGPPSQIDCSKVDCSLMPLTMCTGCNCSILGCGNVFTAPQPRPKCEDGWSLVYDSGMQPVCAKELRKVIYGG